MDTPESDRLTRLEARVAALEARLRAADGVPPAETRATPPAPAPAAERPRVVPPPLPPKPPAQPPPLPEQPPWAPPEPAPPPRAGATSDLERFVGLAVLGRIGIAAVVIAAVYFGQLGWEKLGPAARVFCIYLGAALMLATGLALRGRVARHYVALLCGGSVALTYVAGVVAKLGYDLIGADLALLLLVGSAALGQVLARVLRLEVMATVALAGGYAAPALVGEASATPTLFLGYLVGLHTWAAWMQHRWAWSWARRVAVVATALLGTLWFLTNRGPSATSVVLHVEGTLLLLVAPELIALFTRRPVPHLRWLAAVLGAWAVHAVLLAWTMAHGTVAPLGLVAGAVVLGLGIALRQRGTERPGPAIDLARLGGTVLAVGALACWNVPPERLVGFVDNFDQPWPRLLTLLGAGGVVLALRRWSGSRDPALGTATVLATWLVLHQVAGDDRRMLVAPALLLPGALLALARRSEAAALGLVAGALLAFGGLAETATFRGDAGGWLAAAFLATGAWCALTTFAAARRQDAQLQVGATVMLALLGLAWCAAATFDWPLGPHELPREMLPFVVNFRVGAAVAVLAAVVASWKCPAAGKPRTDVAALGAIALAIAYLAGLAEVVGFVHEWPHGWSAVTISLYTLVFAGGLLVAGFVTENALLRWPGLCGFFLVVAKVAVWDMREVDTPLRVLVAGALGLVLLLGSWAYARARKQASQP
jgi:hypothetical protein